MNKEIDIFFDRYGKPILRLLDNNRIVNFQGKSIGFCDNENLYNYTGKHVGWLEGGVIRDHYGCVVAFGLNPKDEPMPFLPFTQFIPYRGYVEYEPYRPYLSYAPYKPYKMYTWSNITLIDLFK